MLRISTYLSNTNVQIGARYNVSRKSTELYSHGIRAGAAYVNADPDEVVFGSSATQLFRDLFISFDFPRGSEMVVSKLKYEANIASWAQLAEWKGLTVRWWTATSRTYAVLDPDIKAIAQMVHTMADALIE